MEAQETMHVKAVHYPSHIQRLVHADVVSRDPKLLMLEARVKTADKYAKRQAITPICRELFAGTANLGALPLFEHLHIAVDHYEIPLAENEPRSLSYDATSPADVEAGFTELTTLHWNEFASFHDRVAAQLVDRMVSAAEQLRPTPIPAKLRETRLAEAKRVLRGNFGVSFAVAAVAVGRSTGDETEANKRVIAARRGVAAGLEKLGLDSTDNAVNPLSGVWLDPTAPSGFVRDGALAGCELSSRLNGNSGCSVCPSRLKRGSLQAPDDLRRSELSTAR